MIAIEALKQGMVLICQRWPYNKALRPGDKVTLGERAISHPTWAGTLHRTNVEYGFSTKVLLKDFSTVEKGNDHGDTTAKPGNRKAAKGKHPATRRARVK